MAKQDLVMVSIKVPPEWRDRMRALSDYTGIPMSVMVREGGLDYATAAAKRHREAEGETADMKSTGP